MKKKLLIFMVCAVMLASVACTPEQIEVPTITPIQPLQTPVQTQEAQEDSQPRTVSMISMNYDEITMAAIEEGAMKGAQDRDIELTVKGYSDDEVEIATMIADEFNGGVGVVALSAEGDPAIVSILQQMTDATKEYPLVLYGQDMPEAPEGAVDAKVFNGQREAGALAAENLLAQESVKKSIENSSTTVTSVITVVALSDDNMLEMERVNGFIDRAVEICEQTHPDAVEVVSQSMAYKREPVANASMKIFVSVLPVTADSEEMTSEEAASKYMQGIVNTNNLAALFTSENVQFQYLMQATDNGSSLKIPTATYGNDEATIEAVESGNIVGSCYADPYELGYQLAIKAADVIDNPGQEQASVTVPAVWQTKQ